MNDPIAFFDRSITKMHEIPRDELELLQREAMARRFADHRESIEMVRKLADRLGHQGGARVRRRRAAVLRAHGLQVVSGGAARPEALRPDDEVARQAHDATTSRRSTSRAATSIDEWIDRLDAQTPLEVITSSGTTGTISIIPKDKAGAIHGMELWKMFLFQRFGKEPTPEELDPAGRRDLAQLRQGQARPPAHGRHAEALVHRRRREPLPRALQRGGQRRPDVPREQAAPRGVARRARPRRRSTRSCSRARPSSRRCRRAARGDGRVLRALHDAARRQARVHDGRLQPDVRAGRRGPRSAA